MGKMVIISKKGFMVGMGLMLATFLVSGCAGSESKKRLVMTKKLSWRSAIS